MYLIHVTYKVLKERVIKILGKYTRTWYENLGEIKATENQIGFEIDDIS